MKIACFRIPEDLHDFLEKKARRERRSLSGLIRYLLYESLKTEFDKKKK